MSYIYVLEDSYRHVTHEADPHDEWGRDSTDTSWDFRGIEVVDENEYSDFPATFDPQKDVEYYLVAVTYDSADSFGCDSNCNVAYIDLYQTEDAARIAQRAIDDHNESNEEYQLLITLNDGTIHAESAQWTHFFSEMGNVGVYPVKVT